MVIYMVHLRSGKAEGADSAFECGVYDSGNNTKKEIYIPWPSFKGNEIEGEVIVLDRPDSVNYALTLQYAKELHPAWDRLSQGAKNYIKEISTKFLAGILRIQNHLVFF